MAAELNMLEIMWMAGFIFIVSLIYEIADSASGQGYGTLGSPTFILLGFSAKIVVPSILISQACGGLVSAYFHNKRKNADFSNGSTADIKRVYFIVVCGIIGVIIASFIGFQISKEIMNTYIGLVVLITGILILSGVVLKFTWKKLAVIGCLSAFNKGLSGGGYGPIVAGGQTMIGIDGKNSVAITDFSKALICITGFIVWMLLAGKLPPFELVVPMIVGASVAPIIGTWITMKLHNGKKLKTVMAVTIVILGVLSLMQILNP